MEGGLTITGHEDMFWGLELYHKLNFEIVKYEKHIQHQSSYAKEAVRYTSLEFRVEVEPGDLY